MFFINNNAAVLWQKSIDIKAKMSGILGKLLFREILGGNPRYKHQPPHHPNIIHLGPQIAGYSIRGHP